MALLWIISLATMLYIAFGLHPLLQDGYEYNRLFNTLFASLSRTIWGIALSWIIFACVHGYGGYINSFFSLSLFQVLARLSFSIYLTHMIIQNIRVGSSRVPLYFSNMQIVSTKKTISCAGY